MSSPDPLNNQALCRFATSLGTSFPSAEPAAVAAVLNADTPAEEAEPPLQLSIATKCTS